jgi:hypothetical protein
MKRSMHHGYTRHKIEKMAMVTRGKTHAVGMKVT